MGKQVKVRTTILQKITPVLKGILGFSGCVFLLMIILAFTSAPFWIWYGMGAKKAGIHRPPDFIVVLGGGGMPSESGLMRCWYAAKVAGHFAKARVIIALPGDITDKLSSVNQMKQELVIRGIDPQRIMFEDSGTNTRAEAVNIFKIISNIERSRKSGSDMQDSIFNFQFSILLVTSPEHLYRSVLTFKKAGFLKVDGVPAFERAIEADLNFDARKLGSHPWVPDVGSLISIRYQFWMHMDYEFLVLREWFALGYYKLQGWI